MNTAAQEKAERHGLAHVVMHRLCQEDAYQYRGVEAECLVLMVGAAYARYTTEFTIRT